MKELEEKKELVKTLYTKHQLDKQVNYSQPVYGVLTIYDWYDVVAKPVVVDLWL